MTAYNITFQYSETTYCSNIALGTEAQIKQHYSNYEIVSISEASEYDLQDAQRRGKPVIDCTGEEITEETAQETTETTETTEKTAQEVKIMAINYLYFECRGMNDNNIPGDIKNHRIDILEKIDIVFEGKPYKMFFEFTTGNRFNHRKTHKITGKPIKHIVSELINNNGLWTDTQFEQPEVGRYWDEKERCWKTYNYESSWRLSKLDMVSHEENLSFCKHDILNLINRFSVKKYKGVILIEEEATNIINHTGGFREKDILAHDPYFKKGDTWTEDHKIVEVYSRQKDYDYSCQVDLVTGKITG